MLDTKDFNFLENSNFDFQSFLNKLLSYWKWLIVSFIITFSIAYQVNVRKQKIYGLETTISVKDENNPFFTSNTSLVFNWGGVSEKLHSLVNTLKSRTYNEIVVDQLEFYVQYFKQGEYYLVDVYGQAPFKVILDKEKGQLANHMIGIKVLNQDEFEIRIDFNESQKSMLYRYSDKSSVPYQSNSNRVIKRYRFNQKIDLPFLNITLEPTPNYADFIGEEFFIRFDDFDSTVSNYMGINAEADDKGGSIIKLALSGTNKNRIVDYLNNTVRIVSELNLQQKNQFATNTIRFIDSTLISMQQEMKMAEDELSSFRKDNKILDDKPSTAFLLEKIRNYDQEKETIIRKIRYYNTLQSYLINKSDYSKLPAPTVVGIEDPNVVGNITRLISLSMERSKMEFSVKNEYVYREFDSQMESIRQVLLENITSARTLLQFDLETVNNKLKNEEKTVFELPEQQQQLIKIQRKYDIGNGTYLMFLQKKSEARIVKAANLSDIRVIDKAKDVGGGLIGPNTQVNYVLAFFVGLFSVLGVATLLILLDSRISKSEELERLTKIPVIGVIGTKKGEGNLSVFENQKSALAESFRAVRSSLHFLYKQNRIGGSKTLMITSSVSGEGKTFCSINLATVFALSEKKTILVGLDLRKPKIFEDFEVNNNIGVVNYLVGDCEVSDIIQKTQVPFLDVITAGPIPPNPAELLMSEYLEKLIHYLKENYDYIVLDTPPVGLVSDAMELARFADASLYVVRQGVTEKGMIKIVDGKFKKGELHNISIIGNGFEARRKYGYGYSYGYGYGYGYGDKSGYYQEKISKSFFQRMFAKYFKRKNK